MTTTEKGLWCYYLLFEIYNYTKIFFTAVLQNLQYHFFLVLFFFLFFLGVEAAMLRPTPGTTPPPSPASAPPGSWLIWCVGNFITARSTARTVPCIIRNPFTTSQIVATWFTAAFSGNPKQIEFFHGKHATPKWLFFLVDGATLFFSEKHSGQHSHHDCECWENLHVDVLAPRSILQSKDWSMNYLCSFI